LGTRRYELVSI